jgi:hypothetical protein
VRCLALLLFVVLSFAACGPNSLPTIEKPAQLLHEGDALSAKEAIGLIPANKWSVSILKLKPVSVEKEETGIYVTTFAETGVGARGYVVADHKPANSTHMVISDTSYPHIYRFDFKL